MADEATLNPALYFGKTDSWGTVVPGEVVDLVLLPRNPLVDIAYTRQVFAVELVAKWIDAILTKLDCPDFRLVSIATASADGGFVRTSELVL